MWTLIASLYVANVMLLLLNLPLVQVWVRVLRHPAAAAVLGHPGVRHARRVLAVGLGHRRCIACMYAIGVMGFFMRRFDFPIAPVILASSSAR